MARKLGAQESSALGSPCDLGSKPLPVLRLSYAPCERKQLEGLEARVSGAIHQCPARKLRSSQSLQGHYPQTCSPGISTQPSLTPGSADTPGLGHHAPCLVMPFKLPRTHGFFRQCGVPQGVPHGGTQQKAADVWAGPQLG